MLRRCGRTSHQARRASARLNQRDRRGNFGLWRVSAQRQLHPCRFTLRPNIWGPHQRCLAQHRHRGAALDAVGEHRFAGTIFLPWLSCRLRSCQWHASWNSQIPSPHCSHSHIPARSMQQGPAPMAGPTKDTTKRLISSHFNGVARMIILIGPQLTVH